MKYGDILKQLRTAQGLSQQQLTDQLMINRSTYARYETSSTQPDFETLVKLADFFNVSIDYLLGRDTKPYPSKEKEDPHYRAWINDPDLAALYRELPDSDKIKIQQLRDFWEFINKK
ncbi:hypothetical protein GCM10007425_11560 [Lysinibacillus alkalisoli]|uniref:HTH cro/C1-type domain-containing protein n=1 Tax=Lysinibacillus alkalisoli TaxID=1911548 RepID=A0A917LFP0_9BACI|nr:helix-turn-helix transcriptional regulator [Lysinibacillus alkalisoli]GGG18758.1 hypothetical protein GCM10007425_11560 [Lysinibacillus alkalisoli]